MGSPQQHVPVRRFVEVTWAPGGFGVDGRSHTGPPGRGEMVGDWWPELIVYRGSLRTDRGSIVSPPRTFAALPVFTSPVPSSTGV
jgi:hypothetical protein